MSTSLHIDDIGNLILRDGKLSLIVSSQYVTPPHYGGGQVGALCPYAYCAGDPVNCVDEDGEMPLLVTGAIGALVGAGIGAATTYLTGGSSEEIKNAALAGAVGGFITDMGCGLLGTAINCYWPDR